MASLGIDFGSSYTTVSWINPRYGKPEVIKFNEDNSFKYPSIIMGAPRLSSSEESMLTESGLIIGFEALSILEKVNKLSSEDRFEYLSNFIPSIKRILDSNAVEFIGGHSYQHIDLLSTFFKKIKDLANAHCGNEYSFDSVIFSYPIDFEYSKISLMEEALRKAGFLQINKMVEPVAAALGYGIDNKIEEKEGLLIFDFGGVTIDVAFVQKNGSKFQQLCAPKGNNMCGGQDLDVLIYEDLRKRIQAEYDIDISSNNCIDYGILHSCRRLKELFSGLNESYETSVEFVKEGKTQTYKYKLNRNVFNNIINIKVNEAVDVAKIVNNEIKQKGYKIHKVLLIGGSSKLTLVKELLMDCIQDCIIETCGDNDIALGNISEEWYKSQEKQNIKKEHNDKTKVNEISLNKNKSIKCKKCGSEKCYKIENRREYHCTEPGCGWEGLNIKVIF